MRQRTIFLFWLPLFASWLLMTAEGPIVSAAINRLPDEVIMLAAQGIVTSLSVTIESPIINLLATTTALVNDRRAYLLIRRFTFHWMLLLTAVTILIGFTPLFDVIVVRLMGTPPLIAEWVRVGMRIMIFWSAAIAWRRFLQGVLIHFGYTRRVAWGTAVRLVASGGTAIGLAVWTGLPGVVIGSSALMAGVLAEAFYATIAVRPILRNELAPDSADAAGKALTYPSLFWFHMPLAATSLLILLAQPLVNTSLARLPNATLSLAAWPIIFQVLLMARAGALALPEVVIALNEGRESYSPIRRFSMTLTAASLATMLLLVLTPLLTYYVFVIQDTTQAVGELVEAGVALFILFPALTVLVSWARGMLIKSNHTVAVTAGMLVNLALTAIILIGGPLLPIGGIAAAALALNTALFAELLLLLLFTRHLLDYGLPNPLKLRPATVTIDP